MIFPNLINSSQTKPGLYFRKRFKGGNLTNVSLCIFPPTIGLIDNNLELYGVVSWPQGVVIAPQPPLHKRKNLYVKAKTKSVFFPFFILHLPLKRAPVKAAHRNDDFLSCLFSISVRVAFHGALPSVDNLAKKRSENRPEKLDKTFAN